MSTDLHDSNAHGARRKQQKAQFWLADAFYAEMAPSECAELLIRKADIALVLDSSFHEIDLGSRGFLTVHIGG